MTMALLGYNILAGERHLVEDVRNSGAKYHIIVNAPPNGIDQAGDIAAVDWWAENVPNATMLKRTWSGLEGDWSLYRSPKEQVDIWKRENRPQYIYDSQVNEPSLAWRDIELHKRYVKRETEIVQRMRDAGLKYAAGAFGVGLPYESYIEQGVYDDLLRNAEFLSAHLYGTGMPDYGEVVGYAALLDPMDIQWQKWALSPQNRYWLLRRPDWFYHRANVIGVPMPKVLVTECFIDQIPDASSYLNKVDRSLKMSRYNFDLRGFAAWESYWRDVYPNKTINQVLAYMTEHFMTNIIWPEFYEAAMLFAINPLWDTPQGSNYGNPAQSEYRKVFLPAINRKIAGTYQMEYEKGTLTISGGFKNIRNAPVNGTQGQDIGDIQVGSYVLERSTTSVFASNLNWREYKLHTIAGLPAVFWMADEVTAWAKLPDEDTQPIPDIIIDFNGATAGASATNWRIISRILQDIAATIESEVSEVEE
jgi:hypothetical protein